MALDFRVLGPLEVVVDGRVLPVTAPRQQAVLASLVLRANQLVPVERLVGELWDGDPPANAGVAVRMAVSRLRRLLGPGVLVTGSGGYLLRVDPEQIDGHRFERLAAEGRAALEEGAAERAAELRAAELLRAALALWRGPVLGGALPTAALAAEATRLELERLGVLETRVDADLACGRHVEVLGELESLVAEHGLRERLWGQLMVALYRSGRQAQALEAYQQLRRRLVDELGIEPGPELARLHQAVLRHDPELQLPGLAGPPAPEPDRERPPAQLPADLIDFTGREGDLARLDRLADPDRGGAAMVISAIEGMGGIGKSALAIHAAHRLAPRFPDGQLYVNLQGATAGLAPLTPLEVLGRFLRALGVPGEEIPAEVAEAAAVFRSVVAGRRLLVVLDNAADAAQVAPLLPGVAGCGVLVTSRRMLTTLEGAVHLHLDVLAPQEATGLLGRIAAPERIAAEPEAAAEIARLCGYLPLALRIAGARLTARPGWPLQTLADRLGVERERLAELEVAERGVRASIAVSYQELRRDDPAAAEAFGLLGLPDGPDVGIPVVARLLDRDEAASEALMERLVDAQLLETPDPGRYRMHDLVRLYARELAAGRSPEPDRSAALTRALGFYTATAWRTLGLLRPGDQRLARANPRWSGGGLELADADAALAWLETERANLVAAVGQAAATPSVPAEAAPQLAHAMFGFFMVHSHFDDLIRANHAALAAAGRAGDRAAQALLHNDLGPAYSFQGRNAEAVASLERSLAIYRELGDRIGQAGNLTNLGHVYEQQGRYEEALACQRESLAIFEELGNLRGQGVVLTNLSEIYDKQGRYDAAVACQQRGLAIDEELGDRHNQAISLTNLGHLYERQGRHDQALDFQNRGLAILRELADRHSQAEALRNLGMVYVRLGRPDEAIASVQESLSIFRELGDPHSRAESLRQLGVILQELGRTEEARTYLRQALTIFEDLHSLAADDVHSLLAPSNAARL